MSESGERRDGADRQDSHAGAGFSDGGTPTDLVSPGPDVHSNNQLARAGNVPSSVASATNFAIAIGSTTGAADLSGIFSACREATHQLDIGVKAAVSHREKCAVVLGAAVAVNIALAEAEAMHHALDQQVQTQLKRLGVGVLSVLGLAVARVQVYGKFTRAQKATRIFRYAATASKFDELRLDLEALEGQLWNLTGAVGGLGAGGTTAGAKMSKHGSAKKSKRKTKSITIGSQYSTTSMRKLSAGPDKSRRLLRGGASHWIMGGNVRVMCAAGVDGAELWWSSNRTNKLSAFDLFLQSRRAVDAPDKTSDGNSPFCMGNCFGEVTAIAAEEGSALLWTGTTEGEVAAWDTDVACQWGGAVCVGQKNKTAPVTAIAPVASGVAWCAFGDGRLVEVKRPNRLEDDTTVERAVCDAHERPSDASGSPGGGTRNSNDDESLTSRGAVGWGKLGPGSRKPSACCTELIRLGPLVWASMDDNVVEAWDVDSGTCVAVAPHRDLGKCVGIAAHASIGQVVTAHASGAVQLWCATSGYVIGTRSEMVAGPNSSEGTAIGAAALDRLLCVGYRNGFLKVYVLPERNEKDVNTLENSLLQGNAHTPVGGKTDAFASFTPMSPMSPRAPRQRPPAGKIKAHRSGMTLLRAVDGTGHVGVATTGFFGSMIFWPLAELEAAVASARLPDRWDASAKYAVSLDPGPTRRLPFTDTNDSTDSDDISRKKEKKGKPDTPKSDSKTSSLGQDTALISFSEIRLKKCVGEGSFGRVYCAVWSGHTEVAVKMLGPPSSFVGKLDPLERQRGRPTMAVGAKADAAEIGLAGRKALEGRNAAVGANTLGNTSMSDDSDHDSNDDASNEQEDAASAEVLDELEKEVGIMARLRHPNIVLLLGVVRSPPGIVEEYCARGSLFSVLQRHVKPGVPALEWRVRLQMALGAAAGMCYLHNCSPPVIHRDLKSPNLMVDRYFRVKVGDFNLSRVALEVAGRGSSSSMGPENSQGGLHSPRWMAPEVLRAAKYTKASDVYSFGVVLWEIRTLLVPWSTSGQWQVMHAVVEEGLRPPLDVPSTPTFEWIDQYDSLIKDSWAQDPNDRPPFEQIIVQLQSFIDKIAVTHSGRRNTPNNVGQSNASSTEVSAIAGTALRKPELKPEESSRIKITPLEEKKAPPPPLFSEGAPDPRSTNTAKQVDHGAVSITINEAPEESQAGATGIESERAVLRILSRKRSLKLDSSLVPKMVTKQTDAAVADLRASQEWASPIKHRKPPTAPARTSMAAAAQAAAAAAAGAANAASEVEATLSKPGSSRKPVSMSSGTSLARFRNFVSSVSTAQSVSGSFQTTSRPQTAGGRFSSVRASADAVMQSPPREVSGNTAMRPTTAVPKSNTFPDEKVKEQMQSPMLRAIAARKTLEPLDLSARGVGLKSSVSAGHRRTKTLH